MIIVEDKKKQINEVERKNFRINIYALEKKIMEQADAMIGDSDITPLKHIFTDGIYTRQIFIPKGKVLTGKIHLHEHPNMLMAGKVLVATEDGGREILEAPVLMASPSGTKRMVYAIEDCIWITVHANPTNTTDLKELEEIIIAPSYNSYENYMIENKDSFKKKIMIDEKSVFMTNNIQNT